MLYLKPALISVPIRWYLYWLALRRYADTPISYIGSLCADAPIFYIGLADTPISQYDIGLSAYRLIGLSAYRLIGLSARDAPI